MELVHLIYFIYTNDNTGFNFDGIAFDEEDAIRIRAEKVKEGKTCRIVSKTSALYYSEVEDGESDDLHEYSSCSANCEYCSNKGVD